MTASSTLVFTRIQKDRVAIHCCSSPDDGERVNSQIIELENRLVIVDTLLMRPYAKELRDYANAIGKPIDRVYVTHGHPDHWFGSELFQDVDIYALPETIEEIKYSAQFSIDFHRGQHGDSITDRATLPSKIAQEGDVLIDGVTLRIHKIVAAEDLVMMAIDIPTERTLIAQDLIYNKVHFFVGQKSPDGTLCFDGWIAALKRFESIGYDLVLAGHGVPADGTVIEENIRDLEKMASIVAESSGENFVQNTINAFPDFGLRSMVEFSAFFLYQMKKD
jgi:glyoxylase-like metal-dependent hydrolase (beta-lactamase superfamily II)